MKLAIVLLFLCFTAATGLKCVTTSEDGKSTTNEDCNAKYCYTAHVNGNANGAKVDETGQGCGDQITADEVRPYNAKTCDENGVGTQKYDQDGLHADLYCCNTDLCNSANIGFSFIGIISVIIFAKIMFFRLV